MTTYLDEGVGERGLRYLIAFNVVLLTEAAEESVLFGAPGKADENHGYSSDYLGLIRLSDSGRKWDMDGH
jgi:hypothetical protein